MKPIGYWLNRTDKALTAYMNGMLAEFGLTRVAWQVLNVIRDTPEATDADVRTALAANADGPALGAAIDTVLHTGFGDAWATRPAPGRLDLTPSGRERLTAVETRIDAFRELSTAGITMDEYRTAVSVLERMTHNLETR
ncbi:MarR family winged helix-turn-helix transcriptional regulator [Kitasatospora aureofaciens]|uniref:MarR family winged helix-turn-helix transcriptional regulator n=1 Tax=Kitasatospora aureofaciens TaxID=1894 RepID=UPI001C43D37A|nr:MarR family winged helix-turn-helix transcriptional regulator [Kitasatospora aureofaciens]MBV6702740.1 MarR family winged helix-turn-helix transcriptional regulator [Kitasatospora aureofaciens]